MFQSTKLKLLGACMVLSLIAAGVAGTESTPQPEPAARETEQVCPAAEPGTQTSALLTPAPTTAMLADLRLPFEPLRCLTRVLGDASGATETSLRPKTSSFSEACEEPPNQCEQQCAMGWDNCCYYYFGTGAPCPGGCYSSFCACLTTCNGTCSCP